MSTPATHQEVHLISRPQGLPTQGNFEIVETDVPSVGSGEILVRNLWLSVDPYMRGRMNESESYVPAFELGKPMPKESKTRRKLSSIFSQDTRSARRS